MGEVEEAVQRLASIPEEPQEPSGARVGCECRHCVDRRAVWNSAIDACFKAVPTTWLDPLLSGPEAVGDMPARNTEALLRGVQDRIRALKSA